MVKHISIRITVTLLLGVREDLQGPTSQLLSVRNNKDLFNLIAYYNSYYNFLFMNSISVSLTFLLFIKTMIMKVKF